MLKLTKSNSNSSNNSNRIVSTLNYLAFLLAFTFIVAEVSYSIIIRSRTKSVGNQLNTSSSDISQIVNKANSNLSYNRSIISLRQELSFEPIVFRTDSLGSIIPSNFDKVKPGDKYVFFCGGSTTEASHTNEGKRPTDIFSAISGIKSVNLAKSGKGLLGCMKTLKLFLLKLESDHQNINKPYKYVIATSVNSLMDYGRTLADSNSNSNFNIRSNLIAGLNSFLVRFHRNYTIGIKLTTYEHALLDGCCFGISSINSRHNNSPVIDWSSSDTYEKYRSHLNFSFQELSSLLTSFSIPKDDLIVFIEPDSFAIDYLKLYPAYWKGYDARQVLSDSNGKKMTPSESGIVLDRFNSIYINVAKSFDFKTLEISTQDMPPQSFYDAVHTTDIGSAYIGNVYYEALK